MSDEPVTRGRKTAHIDSPKSESPKKRGRKEAVKPIEDEAPVPAKRGRGRPKGTTKKRTVKAKARSQPGRGRGRPPKKAEKPPASEEEEDSEDEENDAGDE